MGEEMDDKQKLYELLYETRDRTIRIETQTERLQLVESKADKAIGNSKQALTESEANREQINKTQNNIKWQWGFLATVVIGIGGIFAKFI